MNHTTTQNGATVTLDLDLARRADRKLRRHGGSLNGLLARIVERRALPSLFVDPPRTIDFIAQGQRFTADVTPELDGGYTAIVRGHGECFTEADTIPALREALVEVTELMLFDIGEPVKDEAANL